jgi:hypothetical protein
LTSLPPAAVKLLQQAAKTPIPRHDPLARVKAVEKAIERVKREYPQYFKTKEINHESETDQRAPCLSGAV